MKLGDLINLAFSIVRALDKNKLLELVDELNIFQWFFIAPLVVFKAGRILQHLQTLNNRNALFGQIPLPFLLLSICSLFCIGCNWILPLPKHTLAPLPMIFCLLLDAAVLLIMQGIAHAYRASAMKLPRNSNNQTFDERILSEIEELERLMTCFRMELQWIIIIRILVDVLCFYCSIIILDAEPLQAWLQEAVFYEALRSISNVYNYARLAEDIEVSRNEAAVCLLGLLRTNIDRNGNIERVLSSLKISQQIMIWTYPLNLQTFYVVIDPVVALLKEKVESIIQYTLGRIPDYF